MRATLLPHPDFPAQAVTQIEAEIARTGDALSLRYLVRGAIGALLLPERAAPVRTDALWKHTCFEAFVKPAGGQGYFEFNLAPSAQWAAYGFSGYRADMRNIEIAPPHIETAMSNTEFELRAALNVGALGLPDRCIAAMTAVIEESNGAKSYWSLAHAPGQPDFHHGDSFVLILPASERQ